MSEAERLPGHASRDLAEALEDPMLAGLLTKALSPNEQVLMASLGAWVEDWLDRPNSPGTAGLLVLTPERMVLIPRRRRSVLGKIKEAPPTSVPLGEVFTSGKRNGTDTQVAFGHNDRGRVASYLLKVEGQDATICSSIWTNELWEGAVAAGGHDNKPPGV